MSAIRWKIARRIALGFCVLVVVHYGASELFILDNYLELENQAAQQQMSQVVNILQSDIDNLTNSAINEAHWDAAYHFMQQPSAGFIAADMPGLSDLNIDLAVYLDTHGGIVYGKQLLPETEEEDLLPVALGEQIVAIKSLWQRATPPRGIAGMVRLDERPLLVTSQPILTSDGSGPRQGALLIGRWVDGEAVARLAKKSGLPLEIHPYPPPRTHDSTSTTEISTTPLDGQRLRGVVLLKDIDAAPLLSLSASMPRDIYRQGRESVDYFMLCFFVGALLSAVAFYLLIDKWLCSQESAQKKIEHLAYHDSLTGLPNRALLAEFMGKTMSHTMRQKKSAALLFLDLDRFKQVNDTYGHTLGDKLLVSVARWLSERVRQSDMVARIGGDQFIVYLTTIKDHFEARLVVQKLLEIKGHPFKLCDDQVFVSLNIGIAMFPADGDNLETLMKLADLAMHETKKQGHCGYQFISSEMNARVIEQNRIESALRHALRNDEFHLLFQPQVDLKTRRLSGAEALLRWKHPQHGELSPEIFIPIAEETGQIHAIGEWVLRAACRQLADWKQAGQAALRISLNVSGLELTRPNFIDMLDSVLLDSKVDPHLIEFELTESVLMDSVSETQSILERLRERGISLAIDDFGTGYSSLSYLRNFPIQRIKIDRSFVRGIEHNEKDTALIDAIMAMASGLNLEVAVEGVETVGQFKAVRERGCTEVQGFYFANPLTAAELLEYRPGKELFYPSPLAEEPLTGRMNPEPA